MAKKNKNGAEGKARQVKAGSEEKVHPDQKAAEREEEKTQKNQEEGIPWPEIDAGDAGIPDEKDTSGGEKEEFPVIGIGASAETAGEEKHVCAPPVPHGSIEGFLVAVDVIETLSAEKWEKDQYTWSMKEGTRLSCCENGRQFTQCTSA